MNLRHVASCGLVFAVLAVTGCDEGRQRPGQKTLRVVNAAPGFAELQFRREQVNPVQLGFQEVRDFTWDLDTYDFYVDERQLGVGVGGRQWTFARTLQQDVNYYTFVLTEVAGEISPVIVEYPALSTTEAQVAAVHAAAEQPAMDLYLVPPGVGIAGATPRGTLTPLGQLPAQNVPNGEYEVWLTTAGNPANVLFASTAIALSSAVSSTLVVTPEAGRSTAAISVLLLQGFTTVLFDRNATAELRVVNGATDTAPRDFAINREFSPPLFSAVPFAAPTSYATVPVAADQPINVTPVGNPGVLELDQIFTTGSAQRWTLLFAGDAGTLYYALAADDGRRIHSEAKLRFYNAASQFAFLDFVLTQPGGDPSFLFGLSTLLVPGISGDNPLAPGDYDLYLRSAATFTIVAGPTPISLAAGGIYSAMAVNGPDSSTASIVLLDDFQ